MKREDRLEAAKLVNRLLDELAKTVPASGRAGSYARAKISQTRAEAIVLLATDTMGPELDACFTLSREAGCKLAQLETVRRQADLEEPHTLGAILVCDCFIRLCLANECLIIATL